MITNLEEATSYFINHICDGDAEVISDYMGSKGVASHIIQYQKDDGPTTVFYVLYKRDWFYSFAKIFKKSGIGQSFDRDLIDQASSRNAYIAAVFPDGKCYYVFAMIAQDYIVQNRTFRPVQGENLIMASIPATLMKRIERMPMRL